MREHLKKRGKKTKRTSILVYFFITAGLGFCVTSEQPEKIEILTSETFTYPAEITNKGQIVEAIGFKDKAGVHIVAIVELEQGQLYEENYKSEIFAAQYFVKGDSVIREWKIWDFAQLPGSTVSYEKGTLEVTDVDGDGLAESSFFYLIASDGTDPWTLKLMLHSKGKKLPIRGKVPLFANDKQRYEKRIDSSFNAVNEKLKLYAAKRWERHIDSQHGDFRVED